MSQRVGVIWAAAHDCIIGERGGMPSWHVPEDLARFRAITTGSPIVMGRKTWESFGTPPQPLPGRDNIVISRDVTYRAPGATVVASLGEALAAASSRNRDAETVWIVGGGQIYREALPLANIAEITEIDLAVDGDTTAPALGDGWVTTRLDPASDWRESRTGVRYRFRTLERIGS